MTTPPPRPQHRLEKVLALPVLRPVLRWMTNNRRGKCLFERVCEQYENPQTAGWRKLAWAGPNWAINRLLAKARLEKTAMKEKIFHHPPTVRALAMTARSIGTHGLTVPQRFTAPLVVVWNITNACNLSCRHCYQNASCRPSGNELTTPEKLHVVDQLGEELVPFLAIAGGEPLMAHDLFAVLERCRERGVYATIATNGTLLTAKKCEQLKGAGIKYLEVSLDSVSESEHDSFRGIPGSWKRALAGIRASVGAGIRTGLACCFTRRTVETAEQMIEFAIELGCSVFSHFTFIPTGRGREVAEFDLEPAQREWLLNILFRYLQEGRIGILSTAPQFGRFCMMYGGPDGTFSTGHAGQGNGMKAVVLSRYLGGCGAGRCYCSIQPDGAVTPCVYIPSLVKGSLRSQALREIWGNQLFRVLQNREDRGDHCGVCDYRIYCGGCRARALAYTGDIQAGDPGCRFNLHEWEALDRSDGTVQTRTPAAAQR